MTPKERAAIQQALESLLDYHKYDEDKISVAIDVLQAALAEQAECPHGVDDGACKECYMEQAEQDLDTCPGCGGVADNGHDREFPPNPYYCTKCSEQAEQEPVAVVEITYGREPECYVTGNIDDFPEGVFKLYAAPVRTKDLTDDEGLQDAMTKSLKKAFQLGQTYFQQADSESYAANKRADITLELYRKLEDDTRAVIAADREKNK